jgi:hypothetical protein
MCPAWRRGVGRKHAARRRKIIKISIGAITALGWVEMLIQQQMGRSVSFALPKSKPFHYSFAAAPSTRPAREFGQPTGRGQSAGEKIPARASTRLLLLPINHDPESNTLIGRLRMRSSLPTDFLGNFDQQQWMLAAACVSSLWSTPFDSSQERATLSTAQISQSVVNGEKKKYRIF